MTSPYKNTNMTPDGTLDILTIRPIPAFTDDQLYTIEPQYNHRPDLLAYDLYGDKPWSPVKKFGCNRRSHL